jgi:hypothetical protein
VLDIGLLPHFVATYRGLVSEADTHLWGIHNILAQFENNPSDQAIATFFAIQSQFYALVEHFENSFD